MVQDILNSIIVNISILVLIGFVLSRFNWFRRAVFDHDKSWFEVLGLSLLFGGIGILSTYTGIRINGAIANTRVIGVIAGGLLGGPLVGLFAGIIAGLHRWLIEVNGFTAVSCAISTILEGVIGGLVYRYFRYSENKYTIALITTFLAEVLQMLVILAIARPFSAALELVQVISVPMVFLNPIGVTIFLYAIFNVKETLERQNEHHLKLAFDIADLCLPYLRQGLHDAKNMQSAAEVILLNTHSVSVAITDRTGIIGSAGVSLKDHPGFGPCFEHGVKHILERHDTVILRERELGRYRLGNIAKRLMMAPIQRNEETVGTIIILDKRQNDNVGPDLGFINGLARLFSSQLALSDMDQQARLLQKAELRALQSQINPHFLFNALNAISGYTRENPDRARQLLISLSSYFRNTLSTHKEWIDIQEEIEHILSYVEIEKARFEERLNVAIDCDPAIRFPVPNFILQPLIENAIKHGMSSGPLNIEVKIQRQKHGLDLLVKDNGTGIPDDQIKAFFSGEAEKGKIGLSNIHQRLKSLYPNNPGLTLQSRVGHGTTVRMFLPEGYPQT